MIKKIFFCADGTWCTTENEAKSYELTNTNARRIFRSVLPKSDQIAIYDDGLGTDDRVLPSLRGGAFGAGIDEKIKEGYTQIAKVYHPGDEIFLFGWSRGAYTVRSLASMICDLGFPSQPIDSHMVDELFLVYRNPEERNRLLNKCTEKYGLQPTTIKFVGVLETVGSLGAPAIKGNVSQPRYGFLDTSLHPKILNAYQAMAIDECRQQYQITLWDQPHPPVKGQTLEQIWFAGCHNDIGGGYPEDDHGLSEIPLKWMAEKINNLGLQLTPELLTEHAKINEQQALSPIHESWSKKNGKKAYRTIADTACLSNSVAIRCEQDAGYRPENLKFVEGNLLESYQIIKVLNVD